MSAPRYKYLTSAYVEWLGLQSFPVLDHAAVASWVSEDAAKPVAKTVMCQAVRFDGAVYLRREDGLSWDRTDT